MPPLDGCESCGKKFPAQLPRGFAARLSTQGFECAACTRAQAATGIPQRTVLLGAEALRILAYCGRSSVPVRPEQARYGARTGTQLALALEFLVHGALEQHLRTLDYAKKLLAQSHCPKRYDEIIKRTGTAGVFIRGTLRGNFSNQSDIDRYSASR